MFTFVTRFLVFRSLRLYDQLATCLGKKRVNNREIDVFWWNRNKKAWDYKSIFHIIINVLQIRIKFVRYAMEGK